MPSCTHCGTPLTRHKIPLDEGEYDEEVYCSECGADYS
jgi:hypothetical protein